MFGKTFAEKNREQKGARYDRDTRRLRNEIERLRAAAGKAASSLSRHLSHQISTQEGYVLLREARDGLVAVLNQQSPTEPK